MQLLKASDFKALEWFAQWRNDLNGVDIAQFSLLESAVQNLDLEQAMHICRMLVQEAEHQSPLTQ